MLSGDGVQGARVRRTRGRAVGVCLAALAVASGAVACNRSEAGSADGSGDDGVLNRIETIPVQLSVKIGGAFEVAFDGTVPSRFVARLTKDMSSDAQSGHVVGVEPAEPVKQGAGAWLAGVGIVPFRGDGTYSIPVGSPLEDIQRAQAEAGPSGAPKASSSIKVDWWPTGDVTIDPESYTRRVKPCTVEVKAKGTEGVVTCPDISTDDRSKHISYELRWTAPKQ